MKLKKITQINRVKLSNPWPGSWDWNNLIERKLKQIMKSNSQLTKH